MNSDTYTRMKATIDANLDRQRDAQDKAQRMMEDAQDRAHAMARNQLDYAIKRQALDMGRASDYGSIENDYVKERISYNERLTLRAMTDDMYRRELARFARLYGIEETDHE